MNILHISRTMDQGGAEKIVFRLACDARNRGQGVCVASTGGCYVTQLDLLGIPHVQIADMACKNPAVIWSNLRILIRTVREHNIDIVHSHHRMAGVYAMMLKAFFPKLKIIYTAHCVFYDKIRLTKLMLAANKVIAVGENVRSNLIERFGMKPEDIELVFNGVSYDCDYLAHRRPDLEQLRKDGWLLVGAIGRLTEQKGLDVLLSAFCRMRKQLPHTKLIIVGDGEQKCDLIRQTQELGLSDDVLMLGYQEYVSAIIYQLDFVVMPSRWEGFPLVPMETFAMGKTLVASNIGGINEIVHNGETGILVPRDEPDGFARAMCELATNTELRHRLEQNAHEYFHQNFKYSTFVENYQEVYHNLMEEDR